MGRRRGQIGTVGIERQSHNHGPAARRGVVPVDAIYAEFLEKLPLDKLKAALSQSDSPRATRFLAALDDPSTSHIDTVVLAKSIGISLSELMTIWRNGRLLEAMGLLIDAAPGIAAENVEDAKPVTVCCPRCDGAGVIQIRREEGPAWIECSTCKGSGAIRKPGDAQSRDLLLKAIGFVKSDAGSKVTIVNENRVFTASSVIEELEQADMVLTIPAAPPKDKF